jgi:hypothetical protein
LLPGLWPTTSPSRQGESSVTIPSLNLRRPVSSYEIPYYLVLRNLLVLSSLPPSDAFTICLITCSLRFYAFSRLGTNIMFYFDEMGLLQRQ